MSKRALLYFVSYKDSERNSMINYLESLEDNASYNIEAYTIMIDDTNPIAEKYKVVRSPTFILLDDSVEVARLSDKKITKAKVLDFIKGDYYE